MFEQAFKNIDDVLWKEAGCTTELDYTEQTSWLLFLKYLDGLEQDNADDIALYRKKYSFILEKPYRWEAWAAPRNGNGKIDHNKALIGDDLRDFVNQKLFPYLHAFKQKATGPNTIEYKIGEIFGEIKNKITSGYNLREIIDHIDELHFRSQNEKHELSHLYEAKIRNMGNAGRNGGEYYTPRPLIRAMVQVVHPTGTDATRFHLIAPFETNSRKWLGLRWVDPYSGKAYRITTDGNTGSRATARVKTYGDVLIEYEYHPESKCADSDGNVCRKQTIGLLQRRHVEIDLIDYIGKESNRLEDVGAGMVHDADSAYTEYPDTRRDEWQTKILSALKERPLAELVAKSKMSRRAVIDLRAGRSRPHPRNQKLLAKIVCTCNRTRSCGE